MNDESRHCKLHHIKCLPYVVRSEECGSISNLTWSLCCYCLSLLICKCRAATTAVGSRSREEEMRMWKKHLFCWLIYIKWISKVHSCVLLCLMPQKNITLTQVIAHFVHFQSLTIRHTPVTLAWRAISHRYKQCSGRSGFSDFCKSLSTTQPGKMLQFMWCMTIWRRDFFQLFFIVLHRRPHMYDVDNRKSVLNCYFALKSWVTRRRAKNSFRTFYVRNSNGKTFFSVLEMMMDCIVLEFRNESSFRFSATSCMHGHVIRRASAPVRR